MGIGLRENRVLNGELCIKYDGYWRTWNRMLHMDLQGSRMVEVALTPINPTKRDSWVEQIIPIPIRVHTTQHGGTDRIYRHVVRNKHSIIFQEVRKAMCKELPLDVVQLLLYEDLLAMVDWIKYTEALATIHGGGVPLSMCRRD